MSYILIQHLYSHFIDTQRGEHHVKTEAETGVVHLQIKECRELLATPRRMKAGVEQTFHPSPQEGINSADTLF